MTTDKPAIKITVEKEDQAGNPTLIIEYINPPDHWRKKVPSRQFGKFEIGTRSEVQWVMDYKFFTIGSEIYRSSKHPRSLDPDFFDRRRIDTQTDKEVIETYCNDLTASLLEWRQYQDLRHENTTIVD